ncbi:hypothetical protein GH714_004793 [Hevea brasiliensis]|uniref:Trigger factor ribosome-binding bacterial domain-containing protein n=1 Tax=Hevea brasiliensis TaxID=3981 RepID=A0A6A6N711_HEVBR|nr:hypothetical protein GH714_004793 [Hevea brasiliensis]
MELAVKTLFLGVNPKLINYKHTLDVAFPNLSCKSATVSHQTRDISQGYRVRLRENHRCFTPVSAVLSGASPIYSPSTSAFNLLAIADVQLFRFSTTNPLNPGAQDVEVSSSQFEEFSVKVSSTNEAGELRIPRDILLEVLGPSKVYKEVIKKVINSTVAEYVEKEGLKVSKDLRVEQSFEDLEDTFEPDEEFSFDAVLQMNQQHLES